MLQNQKIKNNHNFSLNSQVYLGQYYQSGVQKNKCQISTNKDGSVLVVLVEKQESFLLLHYIFEESQYKLIHEQKQTKDSDIAIRKIILNDQGNLLIIAYNSDYYYRYYKKARNQMWTKFTYEQYHPKPINQHNYIQQFLQRFTKQNYSKMITSFDLSTICLLRKQSMIVKSFNINRNQKMINKFFFENTLHCLVCKQENFLIIVKEFQIFFYSIKQSNFLKQLQELKNPKGCVKMQVDSQLKLYILSKNSLQIYERKENQMYCFIIFVKLNEQTVKNFNVIQNTIFFTQYDKNQHNKFIKAFQIDKDKLIHNTITQWKSVYIFPNNLGFMALQNNLLSVYKSN